MLITVRSKGYNKKKKIGKDNKKNQMEKIEI